MRNSVAAIAQLALALAAAVIPTAALAVEYDLVIKNGRVMDPESGLDAIRNIGISAGTIRAIETRALAGRSELDAQGLAVAPGFIDMMANSGGFQVDDAPKVLDGVTTALNLEIGTADVDRWYRERAGVSLVNYGVGVGHVPVRKRVMSDLTSGWVPVGDAARKAASEQELAEIKRLIEYGLKRGAVTLGSIVQLMPGASPWEVLEVLRLGAQYGAICVVHIRFQGDREPASALRGVEEAIAAALVTGAPLHVIHVTSSGLGGSPRLLQVLGEAKARGLDVSWDSYPYGAAMNPITSAMLDEDFRERLGIDYGDLQWVATGERLTAETYKEYRQTGGDVIIHMIPENVVRTVIRNPQTIVMSDGAKGHPRSAGSFARLIGHYARDERLMTLMEALRKVTLMPAQRLERRVPAMAKKGRIKVGADADITVFDPDSILDLATYAEPLKPSQGIKYVLVNGVLVVTDGQVKSEVRPGTAVRAPVE